MKNLYGVISGEKHNQEDDFSAQPNDMQPDFQALKPQVSHVLKMKSSSSENEPN
jgi:hypothetical protein